MDYVGLIGKFEINREITEEEYTNQLKQGQRLSVEPIYQLAVIKLNSTFLESVDKFYAWKGWASLFMVAIVAMLGTLLASLLMMMVVVPALPIGSPLRPWFDPNGLRLPPQYAIFLGSVALCAPLLAFVIWALRKESFAYTHYPIRLNRKNRTIYVFRFDGSVLAAKWDDLFFTLGRGIYLGFQQQWDIRGHVLAADRETVVETFAFSISEREQDLVRRHWEYLRRYMEDGPKSIIDIGDMYLPIANRRETVKVSFHRMWANFAQNSVAAIVTLPIVVPLWLGRLFAMRTSKIPVWPADVEAACRIEPGDPFERDERNNPADLLSWTRPTPR
jgi:hypothetical protein